MRNNQQYDLFLGAVMTTASGTLCTTKGMYTGAMVEMGAELDAVPMRFRELVDSFDVFPGVGSLGSKTADDVFDNLSVKNGGICAIDKRNGNSKRVLRVNVFEDDARAIFFAEQNLTCEELEWLWGLAQKMHDCDSCPVERYWEANEEVDCSENFISGKCPAWIFGGVDQCNAYKRDFGHRACQSE